MESARKPQRTCIACRRKGDQESFLRISRSADGKLVVVEQGAAPGRSAYVCHTATCLEAAFKKDRLSRAFKRKLDQDAVARLKDDLTCRLN